MNRNYGASKAGNWFLASEFDRRYATEGVVAVVQNPGTLRTPGWDGTPFLMRALMAPIFQPPKMGAYTELWAGLSPDVKSGDGGKFIIPWGRWNRTPKKEHSASLRSREDGGTGLAADFFAYCEEMTKGFAG
jgi:NAD(P)-dependent dehydrogenase (short-subunit alcohol dehydrogenase family)